MVRRDLLHSSALAFAVLAGAFGLQACNRSAGSAQSGGSDSASVAPVASTDSLPLTTAEQAPSAPAPAADVLPAAAPAPVARVANTGDDYAYINQAYYQGDAYQDAPPDYAFDYDGVSPWAWQGADGSEFAEPVSDGYRYYYYQPGAAWPYLIRDGGYAYGFDGQQLVEVYDNQGRLLSRDQIDRRAALAGRYLARAQGLLDASRRSDRRSVAAANWAAARSRISAQQAQLSAARSRDSAWQAYDQAHAASEQARWQPERDRRQQYAQRFDGWRQANFQGAPPAPVRPAGHDAGVRQAQAAPPARQDEPRNVASGPAMQGPAMQGPSMQGPAMHGPAMTATPRHEGPNGPGALADQRQGAPDRAHPPTEPQHQVAQAQPPGAPPRPVHDQAGVQREQAQQQHQQADQQRQVAQVQQKEAQQHEAQQRQGQDQAAAQRQQAMQQRQQADQQRQVAQAQQHEAQQHDAQQHQAQAQAAAQRVQASEAKARAVAPRPAEVAQQQHAAPPQPHPAAPPHQEAQQQHQPPHPAGPPAARPAGADEHREKP